MKKSASNKVKTKAVNNGQIPKCPTGIKGFDEITEGGLPKDCVTLIAGSTGSGKTILGINFLINGVVNFNEPGVFMSFEETEEQLLRNVASLNLNLAGLVSEKKILLETIVLEREDILEKGEFNLEGLFVRIEHAIGAIGCKRIVIDSIDSFFSGISDIGVLRLEVKRLFRWLKEKQLTAIVTGEQGGHSFTHQGLEEFVSDCIILLDNRVVDQISTRRIRIIKYRGSNHGKNEYPFVIDKDGLSVIPITSVGLDQPGSKERVSTGIAPLDKMFMDAGFIRGSTILVSGTAGTGKSSLACAFAIGSCKRGENCLYLSYEESAGQLIQNMGSIGLHLEPWIEKGLLKIVSVRPSVLGLEMHLLEVYKLIAAFKPKAFVVDPLTSLVGQGNPLEIQSMLTRMIDILKSKNITGYFTSLVASTKENMNSGEIGVSSLIDTWIVVRELEEATSKKRVRGLYIVKSRGTNHSSDIKKLILSDDGINLQPMDVAVITH